jgi:hypothetical protein
MCHGIECFRIAHNAAAERKLKPRRQLYVRLCRYALIQRLLQRGTATLDDLLALRNLPVEFHPRVAGSIVGPLVRDGIIRRFDWTLPSLPGAPAISVWALTNIEKAKTWLLANPPLPSIPEVRPLLLPSSGPVMSVSRGGSPRRRPPEWPRRPRQMEAEND